MLTNGTCLQFLFHCIKMRFEFAYNPSFCFQVLEKYKTMHSLHSKISRQHSFLDNHRGSFCRVEWWAKGIFVKISFKYVFLIFSCIHASWILLFMSIAKRHWWASFCGGGTSDVFVCFSILPCSRLLLGHLFYRQ